MGRARKYPYRSGGMGPRSTKYPFRTHLARVSLVPISASLNQPSVACLILSNPLRSKIITPGLQSHAILDTSHVIEHAHKHKYTSTQTRPIYQVCCLQYAYNNLMHTTHQHIIAAHVLQSPTVHVLAITVHVLTIDVRFEVLLISHYDPNVATISHIIHRPPPNENRHASLHPSAYPSNPTPVPNHSPDAKPFQTLPNSA